MQLSKKQKSFDQFVFAFLEFRLNGENFEKKKKYIFRKLETATDVLREMCKKSRFRRLFNKWHAKQSQTLLKS